MASNFPNEILIQILKDSLPYDFESLALTSKHMYDLAGPLLSRHNELRRKYRRFRFDAPFGYSQVPLGIVCVPELLLDIAADPIIAQYIVHAYLGTRIRVYEAGCLFSRFHDNRISRRLEDPDEMARLLSLINDSRHLSVLGLLSEDWAGLIVADENQYGTEPDFALAFLLSLLPNLESLELNDEWSGQNFTRPIGSDGDWPSAVPDLLNLVITRANDAGRLDTEPDCPLRKLRTLHVVSDFGSHFLKPLMESTLPFLALNSLRNVRIQLGVLDSVAYVRNGDTTAGPDCDEDEHDAQCWKSVETAHVRPVLGFQESGRYATLGPNLEVLDLQDAQVNAEAAIPLFKDMHRLKVLRMEYNHKQGFRPGLDVNRFLANAAEAVGHHLEHLVLTARTLSPARAKLLRQEDGDELKNLHGFRALTHLALDTKLFIDSSADSHSVEPEHPGPWPTPVADIADHVPSLVDVAPPTLRSFVLHVPGTAEDRAVMESLFRDFAERRAERLPELVRVEVVVQGRSFLSRGHEDWTEQYKNARFCMENGIDYSMVRCHPKILEQWKGDGVALEGVPNGLNVGERGA